MGGGHTSGIIDEYIHPHDIAEGFAYISLKVLAYRSRMRGMKTWKQIFY